MAKAKIKDSGTHILHVTQTGSGARCEKSQVLSLKALGLGKIGKKVALPDNDCIRGLVRKVSHLIKVEDADV
ncbi:MAG: 50S ribosomal protein L30 [Holosporaceae bacterium]|jgi:large subunit ribosomal protein L30|nr:50S ribosomal protein L30 [Holosporaceae bacterium]